MNPESTLKKVEAHATGQPVRFIKMGPSHLSKMMQVVAQSVVVEFDLDRDASNQESSDAKSKSIAVVAMAGKFPDAENPDELWEIWMQGLDLHREIPPSQIDVRTYCDPTVKTRNTTSTPYGCFYDDADAFDLVTFRISPREAAQTDPMQRLM